MAARETDLAGAMAAVLAGALQVDAVPLDDHFFDDLGADSMVMARFCARVRKRADLPNVSMKDVYRNSTIASLAAALAPTGLPSGPPVADPARASPPAAVSVPGPSVASPATGLAAVLAEVVGVDRVSVDDHFFDDLGADSMVMARFCARVRKRADLPKVSMKDIYRHSTITSLATALADPPPVAGPLSDPPPVQAPPASTADHESTVRPPTVVPTSRSKPRHVLCGTLQLLIFLGYTFLVALVTVRGLEWIAAARDVLDVYLRSVAVGNGVFVGTSVLPILVKWTLVGRWKPRQIPVWSLAYVRFWTVKTLVRANPLVRFVGTPLYVLYLRSLGAKIGRGVAILSPTVPVCTDLLTVGAGTVIRKDSSFTCYRAQNGLVQTGTVTLGRNVYVGEATVLDIATTMGDEAQLGHSSSLRPGQVVPAGESWHGSPAEPTSVDHRVVASGGRSILGTVLLPVVQLTILATVTVPLFIGGTTMLFTGVPQLASLVAAQPLALTGWTFYQDALVFSAALFFGSLLLGLLLVITVPRLLGVFVQADRDYRLYGIHYWIHRLIARLSNRRFYTRLFGDSSFIVRYLRSIGYSLFDVEQTGSNFGTDVKHETPYLSSIGSGTVVADGLSIINADYSSTHFRLSRVSIGAHNFLGNRVAYPPQGRTGHNCLLATKVMVPLDGKIREGVGMLGSPSFEIPRTVERDHKLGITSPEERSRRLSAKDRHNAVTILLYLVVRWTFFFVLTVLALGTVDLYSEFGVPVVALGSLLVLPLTVVYFVLVDRAVRGLQAHRPTGCSIYDRAFWRHERFWKVCADGYLQIFNGTPFKSLIWRMLGVRLGRRVFDDGCSLTERSFVTIGDDCTLNAGSVVQCHSQEDGAFKSDCSVIGPACTLGVGAFVHYGVTLGVGAMLEADSFLMKGEQLSAYSWWGGNPASTIDGVPPGIHGDLTKQISAPPWSALAGTVPGLG